VAKFPLAVEQDGGRAAWHDVLAFGDHAETLRATLERGEDWLRKGRPVQIVGYWHENQKPTKDGTVRTVHDLYAAAVRQTPPIGTRP
jgi:single-stranded DNA-binding protein